MTVFTRGTEHYHTLRPHMRRGAQIAGLAEGTRELAHSLQLLRATGIHISLFRFAFPYRCGGDGHAAVTHAFGREGIVGHLPDGGTALMLVNPGNDDRATETRVAGTLTAACLDFGLVGTVETSAVHTLASDVSDLDELLLHLTLQTPRRLPVEPRHVAAA